MEELEQELVQLKAQNEKLKSENQLLKENAKQLIDENRKLLKFKADLMQSSQQKQVLAPKEPKEEAKQVNTNTQQQQQQQIILSESSVIGPSLKRKLNALTLVEAADESAVFFKYVSQPQKQQLQQMFQKFICVLILYTVNLITKETNTLNQKKINLKYQYQQQQQQPAINCGYYQQELKQQRLIMMKITKLKVTLLNLLKLLKYYRQRADTQSLAKTTALIKCNPALKSCLNQTPLDLKNNLSACKLMIFVSLMMNLMKNKQH